MTISNIKVEVLLVQECAKYIGQTINNFSATRNDGKQNPCSLGVVLQIQARVDVEIVPSAAQITLVKYGALSYIGLRVWNMYLDKRTRKIDTRSKTEDASTHRTKRKHKKENGKPHEYQTSDIEKEKKSQENSESETQEGRSTDTDCDQDSDVSFAEDSDKEIE